MAGISDYHHLAVKLRQVNTNIAAHRQLLLDTLAATLPPELVAVRQKRTIGQALRGKTGVIIALEIPLSQYVYQLANDHNRLTAWRNHISGGIVLDRRQLRLDEWLDEVTASLEAAAWTGDAAQSAIDRLLGLL